MKKITLVILVIMLIGVAVFSAACTAQPSTGSADDTAASADTASASADDAAAPADSASASAESSGDAAGGDYTVGISIASEQDESWYAWKQNLYSFFEGDGWKVLYANAEDDATKQAQDIKDLISQSPDAIIIAAYDSLAISSSVKDCKDAGIPVILSMRPLGEGAENYPNVTVQVDTYGQGELSMREAIRLMNEDGIANEDIKVIMVAGQATDETGNNRIRACEAVCEEFGATIVNTIPADWDSELALSGVASAIQADPDINCIFMASDVMMDGVRTALENVNAWVPHGEEGFKYYIASCDCMLTVGTEYLPDGYVIADTLYDTLSVSEESYEYVKKIVIDGEVFDNENVEVPTTLYTPELAQQAEYRDKVIEIFG